MATTVVAAGILTGLTALTPASAQDWVNWESPHVHPIDVDAEGGQLLAVNTSDARVEVYAIDGPRALRHRASIAVGIDPISVRFRTPDEAWVVNRISDTVSVLDLVRMRVQHTFPVGDEPGDVVFAKGRAFVSSGTEDALYAFDVEDLDAAPVIVPLLGEDPRALATDGDNVYALLLHPPNGTGVLHHFFATEPTNHPYAGDLVQPWGLNPIPNEGLEFDPPINPVLLEDADGDGQPDIFMPRSAMIVKRTPDGVWRDENGRDWTPKLLWDIHRHAVAIVDASTFEVDWVDGMMSTNFAIDATPNGELAAVGTHAFNHVRFEPNLTGRFIQSGIAWVAPGSPIAEIEALNPELAGHYPDPHQWHDFNGAVPVEPLPANERSQTLGDPRGVKWNASQSAVWVTGRGSSNVALVGPGGERLLTLPVGGSPSGVAVHPTAPLGVAYVLDRSNAQIVIVDETGLPEIAPSVFHDATPGDVKVGRARFLNTADSSALGQASCQSCHVDGHHDLLAWDLGNPAGDMKAFNQTCLNDQCDDNPWHPIKGPMTTQSLFGIIGNEPFHWRADREDLPSFNPTFPDLLGASELNDVQMEELLTYVASLTYPPNPYRGDDGLTPLVHPNGGNARRGELLFNLPPAPPEGGNNDAGGMGADPSIRAAQALGMFTATPGHPMITIAPQAAQAGELPTTGFGCFVCHAMPTGSNNFVMPPIIADDFVGIFHNTKVAPLRDAYRKEGFDIAADPISNRSTGYMHDGAIDSLNTFFLIFFPGIPDQDRQDMIAFIFSMGTDTHAAVGRQLTIGPDSDDEVFNERDALLANAWDANLGTVVRSRAGLREVGWMRIEEDLWQSDRQDVIVTTDQLDAQILDGRSMSWLITPKDMAMRLGVDRDRDGFFDGDERDNCTDPADAESFPGDGTCCGDLDNLPGVGFGDLLAVLSGWGPCADPFDCPTNLDGMFPANTGFSDLLVVLSAWGDCPGQ
ncbi:MAG: YncE family protein [Phycisphaerales bacterium]